jgi:two-component system cell cycle response regulator
MNGDSLDRSELDDDRSGLYQGRHLDYVLDIELERSDRYGYEVSLAMLQIERFHALASSLAPSSLSHLLDEMGQHIKVCLRQIDYAFYQDGGSFALVLPQSPRDAACELAIRLKNLIETTSWLTEAGLNMHLRVRVGIATYPGVQTKFDLMLRAEEDSLV